MQGFTIPMHNMIKGTYIFYEDGKEIYRASNIITKFGRRFLTNFLAGNINSNAKDMAFGIDSTTVNPDGNDTRLGFEFYRLPVKFGTTDIQTDGTTTYSIVYKTTLPQDVAGQITEIGLYPSNRTSQNDYDSKMITDFAYFIDWIDSNGYNPSTSEIGSKIGSSSLTMQALSASGGNEYKATMTGLNLAGYSVNDSIRLAYYLNDVNCDNIQINFYSSDNDYYSTTIDINGDGIGYYITDNILLNDLYSSPIGSPIKSQINKIGIVITPTSGNDTSVNLDGLRINDEDTFDPTFGLISRAVLGDTLIKSAGRTVDVEYKLDLGF